MAFQEHAHQEALELAVVSLAHGDLLGAARGLGSRTVREAWLGEGKELAERGLVRRGYIAGEGEDGVAIATVAISLVGPVIETSATILQGLPSQVRSANRCRAEQRGQLLRAQRGEVGDGQRSICLRLHPPNPPAGLVAVRVRAGHFVVADDLVIPVHDVEAAIGAIGHRDRAEEGVVAGEQIGELLGLPIRAVAMHGEALHLGGDGVGDGHHQVGALGRFGASAQC